MTAQETNREILILSFAPSLFTLSSVLFLCCRFMELNLNTAKDLVTVAKDGATILAIVIGGIWTYFNFIRGRIYHPRLEPAISGTLFENKGVSFVIVRARLKNIGLTKVDISQVGMAIIIHSYQIARFDEISTADMTRLAPFSVFEDHEWIEPSELIEDEKLFQLPHYDGTGIRVELRFTYHGIEWNTGAVVHELLKKKEDSAQNAAPNRKESLENERLGID